MARQPTLDAFLGSAISRKSVPRSHSAESVLSCITVGNEEPSTADGSAASASTPPTSIDGSNLGLDAKNDTAAAASAGRPKRARNSVATYNENALIRSTRRAPASAGGRPETPRRDLSGKTLVASPSKEARDLLVHEGIQALDLDWRVDALPGEKMDVDDAAGKTGANGKKGSGSRNLLRKASAAMDKTKSVLGKRTRELLDVGVNGARDVGRRATVAMLQEGNTDGSDAATAAAAKKRRLSKGNAVSSQPPRIPSPQPGLKRKPTARQHTKRWLAQGLYVGQEQGFDPRFKPGDNSKRAQKARAKQDEVRREQLYGRPRKMLPMPMFAGKRLMENGRDFKIPFDVFHPLPPGQPKPDEWRKTARNVFVGDAAEYWKVNKKLEYSTCICTPESGCDEDCFNRFMFYECDKNNCNIGVEHCTNRSFEHLRKRVKAGGKYNVGVEVMKTENKGYGVRSCRTFEPGQIIVEYTGEIITQEECDKRMRTLYKDNECFYLMMFDQNMIIDATRGSIARFVNHSCEPNCRMVKWTVDGKPRMALFAGDGGISTGDELTYDYNFDPFSAKNIQECHCGMPSCRGVLGPKVKEHRDPKEALKPLVKESAKRKLKDAVDRGVEEVRSKKRRLSADVADMLLLKEEKRSHEAEERKERAARAALRADIKSARSKRVVAAKLMTKKKNGVSSINGRRQRTSAVVRAATSSSSTTGTGSRKRATASTVRRSVETVRSNVVRTLKGANKPAGQGKTIAVVRDIFEASDVEK